MTAPPGPCRTLTSRESVVGLEENTRNERGPYWPGQSATLSKSHRAVSDATSRPETAAKGGALNTARPRRPSLAQVAQLREGRDGFAGFLTVLTPEVVTTFSA